MAPLMALKFAFWNHQREMTHRSMEEFNEALEKAKEEYPKEVVQTVLAVFTRQAREKQDRILRRDQP